MDKLLLALDFGGTKHSAAILKPGQTTWAAHARLFSPPGRDAAYDMTTVLHMARGLLAQVRGQLAGIGVSFGGPVDSQHGKVLLSHHVPGWENLPLAGMVTRELGAPAAIDNDANAAALGEWRFGAGQGTDSLLYVTISTGVGGGWILNGRIWSGADGMAGEIGHCIVRPNGQPCACGKRGCLEAEASGTAIARKAADLIGRESNQVSLLRELSGNRLALINGEMVAQAAIDGDNLACQVLDDAASALGQGIGASINLINPDLVVLGGGVTKAGDRWWRVVRESARADALPQARANIVPAGLGDDAPLWGASALAMNATGN